MSEVNFGLGSEDMFVAAGIALNRDRIAGNLSFASVAKHRAGFKKFCEFARQYGVTHLEHVTPELVRSYGERVFGELRAGRLKVQTAHSRITAVNTVMAIATRGRWKSVGGVGDIGLPTRSSIRIDPPGGIDRHQADDAIAACIEVDQRAGHAMWLCRELGLRTKEACLLDARKALLEARRDGEVTITRGTKGGQERPVPIRWDSQIAALTACAALQGAEDCLIPCGMTFIEFVRQHIVVV